MQFTPLGFWTCARTFGAFWKPPNLHPCRLSDTSSCSQEVVTIFVVFNLVQFKAQRCWHLNKCEKLLTGPFMWWYEANVATAWNQFEKFCIVQKLILENLSRNLEAEINEIDKYLDLIFRTRINKHYVRFDTPQTCNYLFLYLSELTLYVCMYVCYLAIL